SPAARSFSHPVVVARHPVHADPLVKAERARGILGVDAEAGTAEAVRVKRVERRPQERLPEAAPTPGLAHAERGDPAEVGVGTVTRVAEHEARKLVAVPGKEPQLRV